MLVDLKQRSKSSSLYLLKLHKNGVQNEYFLHIY